MNKKRQTEIYEAYLRSNKSELWQCYGTWSRAKQIAYDGCRERQFNLKGKDFRIIGYNCDMFSVGFIFEKEDEIWFHYETHRTVAEWKI